MNSTHNRLLLTLLFILFPNCAFSQSREVLLTISSPPTNSVVHPGDDVVVIVERLGSDIYDAVSLVGPLTRGPMPSQSGAGPFEFHLTIPADLPVGVTGASAVGRTAGASPRYAISDGNWKLIVERQTGDVSKLKAEPSLIFLRYPGDSASLSIVGFDQYQRVINFGAGSGITFSSSDPLVATVSSNGKVVAQGVGNALITSTRGELTTTSNVTVSDTISGDLDGDNDIDSEDVTELKAAQGTSALTVNDARDLNKDLQINSADELLLIAKCSRPGCAVADDGSYGALPDTSPPTITLTAPSDGAKLSRVTTVSATGSDNVGIVGVQFRIDSRNLGSEDTTAPFSISWDPRLEYNGPHTLSAAARDSAGNIGYSTPINVSVTRGLTSTTSSTSTTTTTTSSSTTTTIGQCSQIGGACSKTLTCCSGRCMKSVCR